jgi:hypothetical protein
MATRLVGVVFALFGLLMLILRKPYAASGSTTPAQDRLNRALIWVVGIGFVLGGALLAVTGKTEF